VPLRVNGYLTRGHVAVITKPSSPRARGFMVEVRPAFSSFAGRFKGHVCGQENGAGDGLETRLGLSLISTDAEFQRSRHFRQGFSSSHSQKGLGSRLYISALRAKISKVLLRTLTLDLSTGCNKDIS